MALEKFRQEDADQMKRVERELVKTLLRFENTEPMLIAITLARCCRTVLRKCNKNDQRELLPILIAFLEGKVSPPSKSGLILPPGVH